MRVFFLRLETGLSLIYVVVHIWVNMCISWVIWVRIKCVFISLSRNYVSVSIKRCWSTLTIDNLGGCGGAVPRSTEEINTKSLKTSATAFFTKC